MIRTAFRQPSDDAVAALLSKTPGPAPWYWRTFPAIETSQRRLEWGIDPSDSQADFCVRLHEQGRPDLVGLAVADYTTVFPLPPALLGLHFVEDSRIRVVALDPDALQCLP